MIHFDILYEDNHLLIVCKPVNVPVQADRSGDADLLQALKQDLKIRKQKPGEAYLGLVHRLDRPVGGVMVFAKTSKAAGRLSELVRRRDIDRTYLAIVRGVMPDRTGRLVDYLRKDHKRNQVEVVSDDAPDAKMAVLTYRTLGIQGGNSLLQVKLHTGRSHQIRVQLANQQCPIVGDEKYGAVSGQPSRQLALWAYRLRFVHPTTKEEVRVRALPPASFPWEQWFAFIQDD